MGLVMVPAILQLLLKLCAIGFVFTVQGSTGDKISPTPAIVSDISPIDGTPGPQLQPFRSSAPSSESQTNGSHVPSPLALPPITSAPVPQTITGLVPLHSPSPPVVTTPPLIFQGHVPSLSPSISVVSPTYNTAPPPTLNQGHEPPKPPSAHRREAPVRHTPVSVSSAPAAVPSGQSPKNSTVSQSSAPKASSPSSPKKDIFFSGAPILKSIAPAVSPSRKSKQNHPAVPPIAPAARPSAVPVVSPIGAMPQNSSATHPVMPGESPSTLSGPVIPLSFLPISRHRQYAPPPLSSPVPVLSPEATPLGFSSRTPKMPPLPPLHTLPPPPPNEDCSATVCTEPYTNTPPGSPCGCVLPMQVGLSVSVALYTFFPLVSELAQEIATGVFMKQSQVHIIGANAASQQPEKTIILVDLVPLGERFDNTTAFFIYQRFWHKQVVINPSFFGDYEVLYVRYLGLPPSPHLAPSGIAIIDDGPYSGDDNNARTIKPLGVDVHRKHKNGLGHGVIAIIALSGVVALVLFSAVAWALLFRHRDRASQSETVLQPLPPSVVKPSGIAGSLVGSGLSSASLSFGSSIPAYAGSAKTFSTSDIERATNSFDASRILGEGGFGRVYCGVLEDGTKVAIKVLKRDDQQGGREFLAEVEMLSRLHHRNLVKLIGICTEERSRSLVYELIPNGSVESHLHGVDKGSASLDWDARIKIALGAARGLAYLHEDSSPCVIHRDFKSSNILLEHDFTPKVSDFGLARTALDEENQHISTRVMGTFGYVAPEYAMTGHLLVKSDVYSYGVVLLELLTGRKPVDMSQPPGQENLVTWARPLLTSKEGLKLIIDPSLGSDVPFDSVAKVAAIASMCVQPEVSNRPFMGEVVQALKLVSNECDEAKELDSRSSSQGLSIDMDAEVSAVSGQLRGAFQNHALVLNYDSEPDIERGLPVSDLLSTSVGYGREGCGSLRRCSSGPLRKVRGRELLRKMRLTGETVSERGTIFKMWPGSH
ncbi:receptor-like serine/threonine-protein kinase ALE2 isoform X10 [Populus trichocarpa]|uniref:receptor-like serine/threonine-protein kinase ALE2 isoform X10 n=1 Tax=Populus trichocarpa TaxID=3694 RepID=UPI000D18A23F|nr:receptor-like serine/threonine-protein kinase ALE2 isoform X10 [Populus trichocarpa]|eukprot:XP_024460070.1 receptor-like serine/threonine-protein kinase ALE2 isoform X9 [Populus trichocarpa]